MPACSFVRALDRDFTEGGGMESAPVDGVKEAPVLHLRPVPRLRPPPPAPRLPHRARRARRGPRAHGSPAGGSVKVVVDGRDDGAQPLHLAHVPAEGRGWARAGSESDTD
jgi:hypothetical protein